MRLNVACWAIALSCITPAKAYINYTTVTGYFLQDGRQRLGPEASS